ncbi:MAG: potassium channel protein [Syntrophobacterales bacterium]|nr:potassium channel protein [Syntrophobacterales bacterium]
MNRASFFKNRVVVISTFSTLLILGGSLGYMLIEDYTFLEGLYMTLITLTTIGFGEVRPLSEKGRLFTILLIFIGIGFVASQIAALGNYIADGQFLQMYRRRKMKKRLSQISNHYIICGYGQMGKVVTRELLRYQLPVVVIEKAEEELIKLEEAGIPYLQGDATEEEVLIEAGINKAQGLVSVVTKDTDNVFIVLTARDLNKDLLICARAGSPGAEKRLKKAGADRVVSPYASGALRIAHNIIRPTVTDFLELALSGEGMELGMEEIRLPSGAHIVGKNLVDSNIRSSYNLIVVAIKKFDGSMIYNPTPYETLQEGDTLIAIGPKQNLSRFVKDIVVSSSNPSEKICSCVIGDH